VDETYKLRRNFAKYLATDYLENPLRIADICDTQIDPTGKLLGYVREEAEQLRLIIGKLKNAEEL